MKLEIFNILVELSLVSAQILKILESFAINLVDSNSQNYYIIRKNNERDVRRKENSPGNQFGSEIRST